MTSLRKARLVDVNEIVNLDIEVIGNDKRHETIRKAVKEKRCIVAEDENQVVGFLIFDTHFFECSFISLIIVKPAERRKGYATSLIGYFMDVSPTKKVFSSCNQSNERMQEVFKVNGFRKSGVIENLDDGDPEIIYFRSK